MISVHRLTRLYGDTTALDRVSFDVRPGRMTGFVGANGAGKTTTMRMMVGVLAPSSGAVLWDGTPITLEQRRRIGYMPEERGLYPKMRVHDQLVYFGRLHALSTVQARSRADELLDKLGIADHACDLLETLSLGNQQRSAASAGRCCGTSRSSSSASSPWPPCGRWPAHWPTVRRTCSPRRCPDRRS